MKTTKFRAWHNGQMYDVNTLGLNLKGINPGMSFAHKEHQSSLKMRQDCILFDEETIFMQFTGLKDKNDKEIYEGDIIRIKHPHKDRTFIGVVEYIDYIFGCKDFYFPHFDIPWHIFSEGTECIEIIGNIYENPEKLKS